MTSPYCSARGNSVIKGGVFARHAHWTRTGMYRYCIPGAVAKSALQPTGHSLLCFQWTEPQLSPTFYFPSQRKVNEHHKQGSRSNAARNAPWILRRRFSLFLPFLGASHCLSHFIFLHWRKGSSPPLLFVLLLLMFTFVNFKKPLLSATDLWQEMGLRLPVHWNQRGELVAFGDLLDYGAVLIRKGAQPQRSLFSLYSWEKIIYHLHSGKYAENLKVVTNASPDL